VGFVLVIAILLGVFFLLPVKLAFATYLTLTSALTTYLILISAFILHQDLSTLQNETLPTPKHIIYNLRSTHRTVSIFIMHFSSIIIAFTGLILLATPISAGPAAYGICQAGCAAVVTACYAAGGATWGATLGATAPATIVACNTAFGTCQAACAAVLLAPTP
jgi:hypothetical protein